MTHAETGRRGGATGLDIDMISEHASPLAALGGVDAGGQNVYVAALASALAERGHRVRVYTRRDDASLPGEVELGPGVRVVHVPAGPPVALPKDELAPLMPEFGRWVARSWRSHGAPDLVHAHFWMSGLAARCAAETLGIPWLQTFHALGAVKRRHQGLADTSPPGRLEAERALAASADLVIATCRDEVAELLGLGGDPDRIAVVPCGVDLAAFPAAEPRPRELPAGERRRIVSLGRLVERKGVDLVVRALPDLPQAELVIAGGPERADLDADDEARRLRALAAELGVADRVDLLGRVAHDAAPALIASADVVACTPWYEPFGMVPLEAMSCARPVVGSAVGGLLDSVADGETGVLVSPRDVGSIAAGLRRVLDDPALAARMGAAGRARVEQRFGWASVAEQTEARYRDVLERRAARDAATAGATADWLGRHAAELATAVERAAGDGATIDRWGARLAARLADGGRVLAAGNGGSAAEAQHFTAELVGRFEGERRPLSAVCLSAETSSLTAIGNDYGADELFARQVEAHGRPGDVLVLLSTSGRSANVLAAAERAREVGLHVLALTGRAPNPLAEAADDAISVDASSTSVVQEVHLVVLHAVCAAIDARLAPQAAGAATVRAAGGGTPPSAAAGPRTAREGVA